MKLIRVTDGVYRNDSGSVHVFKRKWRDKELPWIVKWMDIFSVRREVKFRTLAEVREYLK